MLSIHHLKSLHRYSGMTLAVFLFFHIINHLCALAGAYSHIYVMGIFSKIYRFPPVEAIVLVAALLQVSIGLILAWNKRKERNPLGFLQMASGLYLSFFLVYHVRAVMFGRHLWNVETDFHFAAAGLKNSPDFYFFFPYYSLSIICVFLHLACVHYQKVQMFGTSAQQAKRQAVSIFGLGLVCAVLVMYGFAAN